MNLKTILLGTIATTVLAVGIAQATPDQNGWYVGLEAGWVNVQNTSNVNADRDDIRFDDGWGVLGTAGYAFYGSHWRVEAELGYRQNDVSSITDGGFTSHPDGELTNTTAFLNAVYDISLLDSLDLSLGGGVGVDRMRYRDKFEGLSSSDTDTELAAQLIAGLTWRLSRHWDLDLNYRYLFTQHPDFDLKFCGGLLLCAPTHAEGDMDVNKNTITIGFRYGFDEPPPPPAPAPVVSAPPPPAHFIIFFGFNKCNITAEADSVLSEAASAAKSMGSASVTIVGHTDTVGSPKYNQKLSECRANAAASNLVGKGVPQGAISASGRGETELMVQTGDGVKEPQNRRATIDLH